MITRPPELEEFLSVVGQVITRAADGSAQDALDAALAEADILDLGIETVELDDALRWLAEVVAAVARVDTSIAYVLACRYAGQRAALGDSGADSDDATALTAALGVPVPEGFRVSFPTRFAPRRLLLLGPVTGDAYLTSVPDTGGPSVRRTGLAGAQIQDGTVLQGSSVAESAAALREWVILVAAAAVGTTEAAVSAAQKYAIVRRQFGAALETFAGLRAMISGMEVSARSARALLDTALNAPDDPAAHLALAAAAGRAAVDTALDAIQVHGGYGYIDEYPVAGILRDAISLRARALPRRVGFAALADARLRSGS